MTKKNKTGLSRSENGRRYFAKQADMKRPINTLFDQSPIHEGDMLLRHLELGTIKFSIYNKVTKENVHEVDVTTPFILNALCFDNVTGTYVPNQKASNYFRNRVSENDRRFMETLRENCIEESLQEEFSYFETQYNFYKKDKRDWYDGEEPKYRNSKFFFSRMEARYKKLTGKTFKLNPYSLSYIRVLAIANDRDDIFSTTAKDLPRKIHVNDLYSYFKAWYSSKKIIVHNRKKNGIFKNALGTFISWTGLEVLNKKPALDATTFEDLTDYNRKLNYEVMPRIATDYSMLNEINLDTIPADLWMEIYRLNKDVPPFLVPEKNRKMFSEDQLSELVILSPRVIVDWKMPELFYYDLSCNFQVIYPHLTPDQKADLNNISRLGHEGRYLVPGHCRNYEDLPKGFDRIGNIDQVYDLLSDNLKVAQISNLHDKRNFKFIPCNDLTRSMYENILNAYFKISWQAISLSWDEDEEDYQYIEYEYLPLVIREQSLKLFELMIKRSKDISENNEAGDFYPLLDGYEIIAGKLSEELQSLIDVAGLRNNKSLVFDQSRVADYEKALHYRQLDSIIPHKIDITPVKRRKI